MFDALMAVVGLFLLLYMLCDSFHVHTENTETGELKPCPFCGGKAELRISTYNDTRLYGVFCLYFGNLHGHFIDYYESADEAINAWNRRPEYD